MAIAIERGNHPPEAEGVILVDFDDTICPWGSLFGFTKPFEGADTVTQALKKKGYTIGIFTSRLSPLWLNAIGHTEKQHVDYITEYCNRYNIKFDFITSEKVPAIGYIDDKAITFTSWGNIFGQLVKKGWI